MKFIWRKFDQRTVRFGFPTKSDQASICFSPIALFPGVLERVCQDGVNLLLVHGQVVSPRWLSFWDSCQEGPLVTGQGHNKNITLTRRCGNCGFGPWGGSIHEPWSLNWGWCLPRPLGNGSWWDTTWDLVSFTLWYILLHLSVDQEKLNLLCTVGARDLTLPLTVRAHSTRSVAASKTSLSRVSSKRYVMQQAGPLYTHSSDSIAWIWTPHQGLKYFYPKMCSVWLTLGQAFHQYGTVGILFLLHHQNKRSIEFPRKGTSQDSSRSFQLIFCQNRNTSFRLKWLITLKWFLFLQSIMWLRVHSECLCSMQIYLHLIKCQYAIRAQCMWYCIPQCTATWSYRTIDMILPFILSYSRPITLLI